MPLRNHVLRGRQFLARNRHFLGRVSRFGDRAFKVACVGLQETHQRPPIIPYFTPGGRVAHTRRFTVRENWPQQERLFDADLAQQRQMLGFAHSMWMRRPVLEGDPKLFVC